VQKLSSNRIKNNNSPAGDRLKRETHFILCLIEREFLELLEI
jgi:hypothetical protein